MSYAVEVVDGREDVLNGDVVGNKLAYALAEHGLEFVLVLSGVENLAEHVEADVLLNAALLLGVEVNVAADIYHTVGDDLYYLALGVLYVSDGNAGVLDLESLSLAELLVSERHDLACARIRDRLREDVALEAVGNAELLVVFVSADARHIVAVLVEEQIVDMCLGALDCGRL